LDVKFPAVIDTAQPTVLIAPKKQRRTAVGTVGIENAHLAIRIPEAHEMFA
jgi:hypothetical protein